MEVTILGAGLAGLSAGWELSKNGIDVTALENEGKVGGLAKSFSWGEFTCDLGGHRFFTKNEELVQVLKQLLQDNLIIMPRKSSIYLNGKFVEYPPDLVEILKKFPIITSIKIIAEYIAAEISGKIRSKTDDSFEDWIKNRFGKTLYNIYFAPYTAKAWDTPPTQISADWAAQRISVPNLWSATKNAVIKSDKEPRTYARKFYYPKYGGIGAISNKLAGEIVENNGKIILNAKIKEIRLKDDKVEKILFEDGDGKESDIRNPNAVISTIPITTLIRLIRPEVPEEVRVATSKLKFKSAIFVYIVINKSELSDNTWIYFPEENILANRINEANKFSPYNASRGKTLLVIDITCSYGDEIWGSPDDYIANRCISDFEKIGLFEREEVEEYFVRRQRYAYPLYDLTYKENLIVIINYLRNISNLICIGRSGIFRYNNMDHSMEMGVKAAKNLLGAGHKIEEIATEKEYFEYNTRI